MSFQGALARGRHAIAKRIKGTVWGAADRVARAATRLPAEWGDVVRGGLLAAAQVGAVALGVARGPRRAVTAVFPGLSPLRAWAVAATMESHQNVTKALRNQVIVAGPAWLERVVVVRGREILARLARDPRPVVVAVWHAGLVGALPAALAQCGRSGVMLHLHGEPAPYRSFEVVGTGVQPHERARALLRAVKTLRAGDTVIVVAGVGGADTPHVEVPLLGRRVRVAPGVAMMARLANAAIVPVEVHLRRGRIVVEVFEPLATGADDTATTTTLVAFFEARIAADPSALWRNELLRIVKARA